MNSHLLDGSAEQEIQAVSQKINGLNQQIEDLSAEIKRLTGLFEIDSNFWSPSEKGLYVNFDGLRAFLQSLQDEKKDLRASLQSLQDEKKDIRTSLQGFRLKEEALQANILALEKEASTLPRWLPNAKNSNQLVKSSGSDFEFMDRREAFALLAKSSEKRCDKMQRGLDDKSDHPIAFVADGPGAGKSRYLLEVSVSFKDFVISNAEEFPFLANALKNAIFLRITFGNGTGYTKLEVDQGIDRTLSIRILELYLENAQAHIASRPPDSYDVQYAIQLLAKKLRPTCFVLCIDEVNRVFAASPIQFQNLFNCIGNLSCSRDPFVIPILAGTVILPMKEMIRASTHPPLRIPLPLLAYDSSLQIIRNKLKIKPEDFPEVSTPLGLLVADMGGHPRALEILFDEIICFTPVMKFKDNMDNIFSCVQKKIKERYSLDTLQIGTIIATAFLSQKVKPVDIVQGTDGLTFERFEEVGIVKLKLLEGEPHIAISQTERVNEEHQVLIPYVFASSLLTFGASGSNYSGRFWKQVLFDRKFRWKDWELFNRNYFAFRLSLFSYLGVDETLSLQSFLNGAQFNLESDTIFIVPSVTSIQTLETRKQYPKSGETFKSYTFVLNADGAPFDAFVFFQKATGKKRLLVAFQMKFSDVKNHEKVTKNLLSTEYDKAKTAIKESLPRTDFVLVFPLHREKVMTFSQSDIPLNCILIAKEEQPAFYGELYYRRLAPFD
jgi:hypothetical protein